MKSSKLLSVEEWSINSNILRQIKFKKRASSEALFLCILICMIKPKLLQPGDKIATVSLSWGGPGAIPHRYQTGKKRLEEIFGLKVVELPHTLSDPTWLKNNPQARAGDLMEAFCDPSIKGIFSTIGGDDSILTLPHIDFKIIQKNPKIFLGFSDTTVTHLTCYKAGLSSFYGTSVMCGFAENVEMFPYTQQSIQNTLFQSKPIGEIKPNQSGWTNHRLEWGIPENQNTKRKMHPHMPWNFIQGSEKKSGHLLGGCLETLFQISNTELWPEKQQWKDAILFLEPSELILPLKLYKYFLRSLGVSGILQNLSGIIFGRPGGEVPIDEFNKYDNMILDVLNEFDLTHLPVITRMDFGHTDPTFIIPYGTQATIDPINKSFSIDESGVTNSN